jgi:hypothetical protein
MDKKEIEELIDWNGERDTSKGMWEDLDKDFLRIVLQKYLDGGLELSDEQLKKISNKLKEEEGKV